MEAAFMETKEKTGEDFFTQDQPFVNRKIDESVDWAKIIPEIIKNQKIDSEPLMKYLGQAGAQDQGLIKDINTFAKMILVASVNQHRSNVYNIQRELERKERMTRLFGKKADDSKEEKLIAVQACEEANALMTAQLSNMMKLVPFISELTVKARRDLYHVMIEMIRELNHIFGVK